VKKKREERHSFPSSSEKRMKQGGRLLSRAERSGGSGCDFTLDRSTPCDRLKREEEGKKRERSANTI